MNDLERQEILDYLGVNEFFSTIKNAEKKLDAWADAYPVDILAAVKEAYAWLIAPEKPKRYNDYGRFLNSWLKRAAGPPVMRPPSVNEVLAKIGESLDIKKGMKKLKVNDAARLRELREQAERLLEREKRK